MHNNKSLKKINQKKKLHGFVLFLFAYLFLIPFDGLFRILASKTNIYLINGWKEVFLLAILYFGLIITLFQKNTKLKLSNPLLVINLVFLGFFGIFIGIISSSISLLQGFWGFKILYLPIFLFIFMQIYPRNINTYFPEKIIQALLISSIPIVFFGIWQFFVGWRDISLFFLDKEMMGRGPVNVITIGGYLRAFSTLRSSFSFGDYCSMLLIFNTAYIVFIKNKRTMFYFFIGILMLGGIIASTSRISLITAILGIALIFFFQLPIKLSRQRKIFIFLFFLILTGTSIIGYFVAFHFNASVGNDNFFSSILSTTSILPRFVEWRDVFAAYPLDKFPQLFLGWGTGVVGVAQAKFIPDSYFIDNFYILVLVMHGIVGLFLWLVFFGAHLLKLLNFVTAKSSRDCQHYWFIVGTLAFITSQFIEFLFRTTLEGFPMQIYFWVFWGLSMRCMHLYNISLTQSNASELR